MFLLFRVFLGALEPIQPSAVALSPGVRRAGRESDHSGLSSAEITNA